MVRLFSHYVSLRLVALLALEALVLILSIEAGLRVHAASSPVMAGNVGASVPLSVTAFGLSLLMVTNSMGLYQPGPLRDLPLYLLRAAVAVVVGLGMTVLVMHLVPSFDLGLDGLAVATLLALTGSAFARLVVFRSARLVPFKPRVLVLGTGAAALKLDDVAQRNENNVIVGYVALESAGDDSAVRLPRVIRLAPGETLPEVVDRYQIDQIVIAVRDRRGGALPVQQLLECRLKGVRVTELSSFFEREHRQILLDTLTPSWMVFAEGFRQGLLRTTVKRAFDVAASTALLLVSLPVMAVSAACLLAESGLPLLYRQERVGRGGRIFTIYKFRSMKRSAESDGKPRWAGQNDDRITRVGRVLRKLRIDELPQIFNVLKGEMTFVGPRPERPYFVEQLRQQIPYYSLRHSVKPGITGWAQVRYSYGASVEDAIEKLQYDLYYIKNHTLFLDLVILASTAEVVLWGGGSGAAPRGSTGMAVPPSPLPQSFLESK